MLFPEIGLADHSMGILGCCVFVVLGDGGEGDGGVQHVNVDMWRGAYAHYPFPCSMFFP